MEATLCLLRPTYTPANNLHSLLPTHKRLPTLTLRGVLTPITLSNIRVPRPLTCAHVSPPPDNAGNGETTNLKRAAGVGAAVVLACLLGFMGSTLKRGGIALAMPLGWQIGRPSSPSSSYPMDSEKSPVQKSLDVLSEIFQRRTKGGTEKPPTLLKLLAEQLGEAKLNKEYPSLLEVSDKGGKAAALLRSEWEKKTGYEQYELGLLLIDVFLNQGEYKKADCVHKKIPTPSSTDVRYLLHKAIINMMLAVDDMLLTDSMGFDFIDESDETKELRKSIDGVLLKIIEYRKKIDGKPPALT